MAYNAASLGNLVRTNNKKSLYSVSPQSSFTKRQTPPESAKKETWTLNWCVLLPQTLMQGPRYIEGEKQDAVCKLQGPVQEGAGRHSGGAPSNWPEWNEHGHHQVASPLKQPGHCTLQGRISSCMPFDSFCVGNGHPFSCRCFPEAKALRSVWVCMPFPLFFPLSLP